MRILDLVAPLALMCLSTSVLPTEALADFQGTIDMKMTSPQGSGNMTLLIGKGGVRSHMSVQSPIMPMNVSMLVKHDNPDLGFLIHDENKTYSEIDLKTARENQKKYAPTYTAKKLGKEKMLGYACEHALLASSHGGEIEVWTDKQVFDYETFLRATGRAGLADEGMMKALKSVGADGFFIKLIHRSKNGVGDMTMEVVKIDKTPPPKDNFEIPAGYTKAEDTQAPGGLGHLPPGAAEQMKNMTPEQRKMMQDMIDKYSKTPTH